MARKPQTIQLKKVICGASGASSRIKPIMMMFGGVPIGVRTPPMEQA